MLTVIGDLDHAGASITAQWMRAALGMCSHMWPATPPHETAALSLRFLRDDIKALCSEAAQVDGPAPASRQIDDWFWSSTAAGRLLRKLRTAAMVSDNNALKTVGSRLFIHSPFV